jgi:hypothetical protein
MSETTTPTLDSEMLAAAREAGADDLFIMAAAVDPDAVEIARNYVADEVARTLDSVPDGERAETLERDIAHRGEFILSLWDGDLAEALYHADGTNKRLLFRLLADDVMMSALIEDRGTHESARRWFRPNAERYGWEAADTFNHE